MFFPSRAFEQEWYFENNLRFFFGSQIPFLSPFQRMAAVGNDYVVFPLVYSLYVIDIRDPSNMTVEIIDFPNIICKNNTTSLFPFQAILFLPFPLFFFSI
jgi:hypothetical protein